MEVVIDILIVFLLLYGLAMIWIFWTKPRGAPWVTTPRARVRKMLELAGVGPGDLVYDLGCGDGRILVIAARQFGARAVGIEIDPLRYLWCRALVSVLGLSERVQVIYGDFFKQDLSRADVVVMFLQFDTNDLLSLKLVDELRPGTRVVSHVATFSGWTPTRLDQANRLYLYEAGKFLGDIEKLK
jgi:SAM-dependent methyltransferase